MCLIISFRIICGNVYKTFYRPKYHAHLSLCAKSKKTNDAKSSNGQKPQFGQFFDDFEAKYLEIANFSEK